jgi:3-methyladenine DNA glycosylase Mpg
MTRDEFETLLGSLSAQYAEASAEEVGALEIESVTKRELDWTEARIVNEAYENGAIYGKNPETRAVQTTSLLQDHPIYRSMVSALEDATTARKLAAATRIGIEYEIKLWRAWLAGRASDAM